jgi:hypothetical protein
MHATVRRYEGVDDSRTDEVAKKVDETLLPRLSKLPGFEGYYLIEAGNGVMSSIGLFDTSAHADESTRIAATWAQPPGCARRSWRRHFRIRRRSRAERSSCRSRTDSSGRKQPATRDRSM